MGKHRAFLAVLVLILSFGRTGQASSGKEFTTSVIYGTLAGTLVGAATLAFTSSPGDNLNNVARGASFGLYAGILLGIYVTYAVPDEVPPDKTREGPSPSIYEGNPQPPEQQAPPAQDQQPQSSNQKLKQSVLNGFALYPLLPSASKPQDWGVGVRLLNLQF